MRILQLGKFYPIRGGVEKVMYDLTLGLSEKEIYCDMLCASTEDHVAEPIRLNNYGQVIVLNTKVKMAATMIAPDMVSTLRRIKHRYDIIHIHHPDPMATLALFLSGYKGKVVLHWHSDILKQKALLKLYSPLQSWLIRRADIIVGTTPVYVDDSPFLQYVKHKIDYIPIGTLPVQSAEEKVAQIRDKYPNKCLIFSLGRLVEYKGYEYLIRSALFLDDNYHIVIGGKGPLEAELKDLIVELKVEDKVTLLGYVSDAEVGDYFQAADIFCLSSILKTEAFAIVQIEAMSCGKPVVCSFIPGSGVSWVNRHGFSGLVVDQKNPQSLAEAFHEIYTDKTLFEQLKWGSRNRYENHFTRDKMVQKCMDIYARTFVQQKGKTVQPQKINSL
ncbi:glycosyltransferase [Sphingobacterium ginsenosidimutans]